MAFAPSHAQHSAKLDNNAIQCKVATRLMIEIKQHRGTRYEGDLNPECSRSVLSHRRRPISPMLRAL